jgi:hypothetical protein
MNLKWFIVKEYQLMIKRLEKKMWDKNGPKNCGDYLDDIALSRDFPLCGKARSRQENF